MRSTSLPILAVATLLALGSTPGHAQPPAAATQATATTDVVPEGEVRGRVDNLLLLNDTYYLYGWACQVGYAGSIDVHTYVGGNHASGTFLIATRADLESEPAVSEACGTTGVHHRFLVPIAYEAVTTDPGESLYVHGISPSGPPHALLLQSGVFAIPDRVTLSYVTTHDPSWDLTLPVGLTVDIDTDLERGLLRVLGRLECPDDGDFTFEIEGVEVRGPDAVLECGTESFPFDGTIDFVLVGNRPIDETSTQPGKEFLVHHGATLRLIGRPTKSAVLKLAASAPAEARSIVVDPPATGWAVGDTIVVGPTGFDPHEAEERTIVHLSADRRMMFLDRRLDHDHWGGTEVFSNGAGRSWTLDQRAEVINLSRRIRVRSAYDLFFKNERIGAHMMIMGHGSAAFVDSVEFFRVGQMGELRRYPFHWHLMRDVSGQYIKNSSIHQSLNRCITVHGTDDALVQGNACYDHYGHGFFLEDGSEQGNVLVSNIGMLSRKVPLDRSLLESDSKNLKIDRFPGPSTFWISNPYNDVSGNIAAGSEGTGFWMAFSKNEICSSYGCSTPTETDTLAFRDNVAHSSKVGVTHDGGPNGELLGNPRNPDDRAIVTTHYSPDRAPTFDNIQAFKNSATGIYFRGDRATYTNNILADNGASLFFAFDQAVEDSLVVGMSQSLSADDLDYLDAESFRLADDLIGILVYDGPFMLNNVHVANFPETELAHRGVPYAPTAFKLMGGLARYVNVTSGLTFDPPNPYKKIDLRRTDEPRTRFWSDSYTVAIRDLDGSLAGVPGAELRPDHPLNWHPTRCSTAVEGGAFVCTYRTAHLRFRNRGPAPDHDVEAQALPFTIRRDVAGIPGIPYAYAGFPNAATEGYYNKVSMILDEGYSYHVTDYPFDPVLRFVDLFFTSEVAGQLSPVISVAVPAGSACSLYGGYVSDTNGESLPMLGSLAALEDTTTHGYVRIGSTIYFRLLATRDEGTAFFGIYGLRC